MRKHVVVTKFPQRELGIIRVSAKVLNTVETLSETSQSFAEIFLIALVGTVSEQPAEVDASRKGILDVTERGRPATGFIGDVVLHASVEVDGKFSLADGSSEAIVVLPRICIVCVVLGVVDMLLRTISTQPFGGHFEFSPFQSD